MTLQKNIMHDPFFPFLDGLPEAYAEPCQASKIVFTR